MMNGNCIVPRVGVISVSSPLEVGAGRAPQAAVDLGCILESQGCEAINLGLVDNPGASASAGKKLAESHVHAVAIIATSWFEDYLALDLLEECNAPVLLWALPGMETGALCGTQQLSSYLKRLNAPYRCIYGPLDNAEGQKRAMEFLRAAALKYLLRRSRIGFAGYRVQGMTETSANEFALKKTIGARIVPLDVPQLLSRAEEIPDERVRSIWRTLAARSAACEVAESAGLDSMKVYAALQEEIERLRLDALTIGCYPHLMGRVCLAASLLADAGIPLGCEGDVNGAVGQLLLTRLTGRPTHNTDWLEPLPDGTVVLTHCGAGSFSLAENPGSIRLSPVRLMNQGVCALFTAKPGPVTLLNLMPRADGYQIALLEGDAISTDMVFPGNPLRIRFTQPTPKILDWIYDEGIGHHWMAGYGSVGGEIQRWAELCGTDLFFLDGR
jgi:L-fucose isomerase-like protein